MLCRSAPREELNQVSVTRRDTEHVRLVAFSVPIIRAFPEIRILLTATGELKVVHGECAVVHSHPSSNR